MLAGVSWLIERRLKGVGQKLSRAREELAIAEEQLVYLADDAADAQVRSVVAEGGSAGLDYNEAQRHSDAMARHRRDLVDTIARLEATQDELLDQLVAKRAGS